VTCEISRDWITHHFERSYREVTTDEIAHLAERARLDGVSILKPRDTGFYQPIILAAVGITVTQGLGGAGVPVRI